MGYDCKSDGGAVMQGERLGIWVDDEAGHIIMVPSAGGTFALQQLASGLLPSVGSKSEVCITACQEVVEMRPVRRGALWRPAFFSVLQAPRMDVSG